MNTTVVRMSSELVQFHDPNRDTTISLPVRSHKHKHGGVWYRGSDGRVHHAKWTVPTEDNHE